jgi:uncharacterized cofD-like protein
LAESSRVLAVQGRVFPSTLQDVKLVAHVRDGENGHIKRVVGESRIPKEDGSIEQVLLEPESAPAYPDAVRAVLGADLILAGPGSLYTSVLPNLLVSDIAQAVRASRALKMYVCNVATQIGETDHFTVADHVSALERHVGRGTFPYVLANGNVQVADALPPDVELVAPPTAEDEEVNASYQVVARDLVDAVCPWRHDPQRLCNAIFEVYRSAEG